MLIGLNYLYLLKKKLLMTQVHISILCKQMCPPWYNTDDLIWPKYVWPEERNFVPSQPWLIISDFCILKEFQVGFNDLQKEPAELTVRT